LTSVAEVRLWGRTIGAVSLAEGEEVAAFEYDPAFAQSGIEISPITMPLSNRIYTFPELTRKTFYGLPGLLADSLPDKFGHVLIDAWLATQGRQPGSFNAIERLCYTGERGMGALEFVPATGPRAQQTSRIEVHKLVELASEILTHRNNLQESFADESREQALLDILRVGTSAGGARAKAVIAWNPSTNEVRSGQVSAGKGFEYWLLKFDGVANREHGLRDPQGYGKIEYAYHLMALSAGIQMMPCRMLHENGRSHFMTRRFDRHDNGDKIHMQSLFAMAHLDNQLAGAHSYEQAFQVIRRLGMPHSSLVQQFRRTVFNIVARNQDDHTKNIAFLMEKDGVWRLAPAFDVIYAFNPAGDWTSRHQMTVNGRRDGFSLSDLSQLAEQFDIDRPEDIVAEIEAAVSGWGEHAVTAGVSEETSRKIAATHRSLDSE